jgi:hypothetical protein
MTVSASAGILDKNCRGARKLEGKGEGASDVRGIECEAGVAQRDLELIADKADGESPAVLRVILDRMIKVQRNVAPLVVSCGRAYNTLGESLAEAHGLLDADQEHE